MSTNQVVIELKQLIQSEISDFFAGFEQPGEPENANEMNSQLQQRVESCFDKAEEIRCEQITLELADDIELTLAHQHIDELHECIANEDIEAAKRLMADFINIQVPF
uniref:Uncharacterized protein n=1 Tax=Shewanella sp. (strain MR-7) TaxID=60481 RepID=Q0HYU6_SHESR